MRRAVHDSAEQIAPQAVGAQGKARFSLHPLQGRGADRLRVLRVRVMGREGRGEKAHRQEGDHHYTGDHGHPVAQEQAQHAGRGRRDRLQDLVFGQRL